MQVLHRLNTEGGRGVSQTEKIGQKIKRDGREGRMISGNILE